MQTFAINTDEDEVLDSRHVAFFVSKGDTNDILYLGEVVCNTYKHPQAPELATIQVLETRTICSVKSNSVEAAPLRLFSDLHQTTKQIYGKL
jgi:hypothetical protein